VPAGLAGCACVADDLLVLQTMLQMRTLSATHCSTLQHTVTHCNTLPRTATHCNTLERTATHCDSLQHTATHCNTLQHTVTHCHTLPRTVTHYNALQRTAARPMIVDDAKVVLQTPCCTQLSATRAQSCCRRCSSLGTYVTQSCYTYG